MKNQGGDSYLAEVQFGSSSFIPSGDYIIKLIVVYDRAGKETTLTAEQEDTKYTISPMQVQIPIGTIRLKLNKN